MKKLSILFFAGLLISVLFVGCNELEEGTEINPVPVNNVDDEVAAFFYGENCPPLDFKSIEGGGIDDVGKDYCVMINSMDKLREIYRPNDNFPELPTVDFDSYTLIGGQWIGGGSLYLMSKNLVVEQDVATMNLTIAQKKEYGVGYNTGVYPIDFWGLYPKIEVEHININVIRK